VLIVDDEPAMLLVLKRMLSKIEGIELVGSFQSAVEALNFVRSGKVDIHLAILDIVIAADNGLQLARSLRSLDAELGIVFTTSSTEYALDAYDVYPLDYIVKPISSVRLAHTIARAQTKSLAAQQVERFMEQESSQIEQSFSQLSAKYNVILTAREKEVLQGIAAGWSNEEIAEKLQISLSTVKVHTRNVFNKLEVSNRVKAVVRAQQLLLLEE
jgi:DNA-binding NarL/FixJ family response regulator